MSMFNEYSRTSNILKSSAAGVGCKLAYFLIALVYRFIFIHYLSAAYLGINGLFSNLLQIISFVDLGISTSIGFRLYRPISENNYHSVGQLMNFYKNVYGIISLIVLGLGMALFPFVDFFIKEKSEIPYDINIHVVFVLFLVQTVSSYLCVWPQTLLEADQKKYKLTIEQTVLNSLKYILQIITIIITKKFMAALVVEIVVTITGNILISSRIKKAYSEVFCVKDKLDVESKRIVFNDTRATLCHKVGETVLKSTDSIVMSSFVGLVATGIYSNYALIFSSLLSIINQMFGSFTASLGNAHFSLTEDERYNNYQRLLFLNFWVVGMCTTCLVCLISDFVSNWLGEDMLLSKVTIAAISIQFYIEAIRVISISYTFGSEWFLKDKMRPFIEASINLIVSIILVKKIGIAGVFIGTIISHISTVSWREPYILYKYEFHRPVSNYWMLFAKFSVLTIGISACINGAKHFMGFSCQNFIVWVIEAIVCLAVYNIIMIFAFRRDEKFLFCRDFLMNKLKSVR